MKSPRMIIFYLSALASLIAIVLVPFFEHWYSVTNAKEAWSALASPELHLWLRFGGLASLIAFVGSFFGRGWKRIVAILLSLVELYFWFVLSIAA